jgi:hypothetical protein
MTKLQQEIAAARERIRLQIRHPQQMPTTDDFADVFDAVLEVCAAVNARLEQHFVGAQYDHPEFKP